MGNKLQPPIASPANSQAWMLWHKDLGKYLENSSSAKAKEITGTNVKMNYNLNGAIMNIQYYGATSTADNAIVASLPVQCKYRSVVTITYSDGTQGTLAIEEGARTITLPVNTKDLTDKTIHIQGQVLIG